MQPVVLHMGATRRINDKEIARKKNLNDKEKSGKERSPTQIKSKTIREKAETERAFSHAQWKTEGKTGEEVT